MALLGKTVAIASVGISCQTAHQINTQREFIETLVGEKLEEHSTPFDWMIAPAFAVSDMIMRRSFAPDHQGELSGTRRPYWEAHQSWFWHEVFDDFGEFQKKRAHAAHWWDNIGLRSTKYFFISNTQNNLEHHDAFKSLDRSLDIERLSNIAFALGWAFGAPRGDGVTKLHDVQYNTKQVVSHATNRVIGTHFIVPDDSQWHGSESEWRKVFSTAFESVTVR